MQHSNPKQPKFNSYSIHHTESGAPNFSRRDFYKIVLSTAHMIIHYADQAIEVNGTFLFFANPHVPYSIELLSSVQTGCSCLFNEEFLQAVGRSESIHDSPLFNISARPVLVLNQAQVVVFETLFGKILAEQNSDYAYKDELILNYIQLIIHEALKIQPSQVIIQPQSAASRIATLFLALLERQFPIEDPQSPLQLRTAQDYANRLSIHVNHLNRAVKAITGKPTTTLIAERIVSEAKALLQHTNWPIAEIAYSLGFDYTTHFNNYFKRVSGTIPKSFRA